MHRFLPVSLLAILLALSAAGGCLPVSNDDDSSDDDDDATADDDDSAGDDDDSAVADEDGDGVSVGAGDCDDEDASVFPGATETWYDGVDQDCSGGSDYDQDGDGHDSDSYGGDDCDDTDVTALPGGTEIPDNGVDEDCSGADAVIGPLVGSDTASGAQSDHGGNYLLGQAVTLGSDAIVTGFGIICLSGGSNATFGLYTDSGGAPGSLVVQSVEETCGSGNLEMSATAPTVVSAGTYWFMGVFSADTDISEATAATTTTYFGGLTYTSTLPTTFSSDGSYTDEVFDYYLLGY